MIENYFNQNSRMYLVKFLCLNFKFNQPICRIKPKREQILQNPKKAHKSNEATAAVTVKRQRNAHHRRKADRHHDIYTHVNKDKYPDP